MQTVGQKMGGTKKLIIGLISVLVLASATCFYLARTRFSEAYLSTASPTQAPGHPHDLVSFDQQGNLLGVSMKQGRFQLDRFHLDSPAEHAEVVVGSEPAQWILGPDGLTLAWLSGVNQISIQRAAFPGQAADKAPWPQPKTVITPNDLVTFGVLQDGTVGIVLASGVLVHRDPESAADGSKISLGGRVKWAQIHGDYAAVVMGEKIRMYHLVKDTWSLVDERSDFNQGSERRLPADGQMLAVVRSGIRVGDVTLNTPGKVSDVAMSDQGFVLVSGEFKGVFALPLTSEAYLLADAPEGVQLAASRNALGYTGPSGTVMIQMIENFRLTEKGRLIVAIATALVILAILAALLLLYIDGKGLEPSVKRKDAKLKDTKLPKPPPDLIRAISSGEATLWAGAGVSASSGLPLRNAFISSVFQTALNENWKTAKQMDQYWKLVTDSKTEEALDKFIASDAANRIRVNDLARATYSRFCSVNPMQRQLAKLPFNTAITTNYDALLERCGSEWALNTAAVDGGARVLALGSHLTVKLYGDFESGRAPILGRAGLGTSLQANPEFVSAFTDLFEARPILFVGASLEGLLVDLEMLTAPRPSGIKHYCIAGVSTLNWKPKANELKSRYNIEVFPCDVLNIGDQLKVFLAELSEAVEAELVGPKAEPRMGQTVG